MTRIRYDVLLSIGSNIAPDESVPRALALLEKRFHGMPIPPSVLRTLVKGDQMPWLKK